MGQGGHDHEGEGAHRGGVAQDAEGTGDLHLLPLCCRRRADSRGHRLGAIAIAYETVQLPSGELPLLTPMSEVAGRMAVQEGAKYLGRRSTAAAACSWGASRGGPAKVVIIGGGVAGINAAKMAAGMGANTTILDISLDRLRYLDDVLPANVKTIYPNQAILEAIERRPGHRGRIAARRQGAASGHPRRPQADAAGRGDRGRRGGPGRLRRDHQADHPREPHLFRGRDPALRRGNMPGGVPRTSTLALTNATLPYGLRLAKLGWKQACKQDRALALGLNVVDGKVVYPGVAEAFGLPLVPGETVL